MLQKVKVAMGDTRKQAKRPRKGPFIGQIPYEVEKEMFAVYCAMPVLNHVSRQTGVSIHTVRKYHQEQDWEKRRMEIIDKAREAADYDLQKATEQSITLVRALKSKVAEKIRHLSAVELNTDSLVADTERLVKLEQILLGGVSDRQERIAESHEERLKRLKIERDRAIDVTPQPPALTN
jgi:hypothetical protein